MGPSGMNRRDAAQFLNVSQAQLIQNYLIEGVSRLRKRKGLFPITTIAGGKRISMLESYTDDICIVGYGNTVSAYEFSTQTLTVIATGGADTTYEGARYGEYFFIADGINKIRRATLSGGLWSIATITDAPIATTLAVIGTRLAANTVSDPTVLLYSAVDDGSNPPFTNWTVGTDGDDAGKIANRQTGAIQAIRYLGNNIVVLAEKGKWAFMIDVIDSGGTLKKVDTSVMSRVDFGGSRAAEVTNQGLVYANEKGLWQVASLGQSNVPFSVQETNLTLQLGETYFADIDVSNADLYFDAEKNTVFLTCAKDSNVNNLVIGYNFTFQAIFLFTGWTVSRFMVVDTKVYGASDTNATKVWECLRGNSDDGASISTIYRQELADGLETRQMLNGFYVQGSLSPSSDITICFDIYNRDGEYEADKLCYHWTTDGIVGGEEDGWGEVGFGEVGWSDGGSGEDTSGMVNSFDGASGKIRNYQRLILRLKETSELPHILTWVKVLFRTKIRIRRRHLSLVTN